MYTSGEILGAIRATLDEGQIEFANVNRELDEYSRFIDLYTTLTTSKSSYPVKYINKKDLNITVVCEGIEVMLSIEEESIMLTVEEDD